MIEEINAFTRNISGSNMYHLINIKNRGKFLNLMPSCFRWGESSNILLNLQLSVILFNLKLNLMNNLSWAWYWVCWPTSERLSPLRSWNWLEFHSVELLVPTAPPYFGEISVSSFFRNVKYHALRLNERQCYWFRLLYSLFGFICHLTLGNSIIYSMKCGTKSLKLLSQFRFLNIFL